MLCAWWDVGNLGKGGGGGGNSLDGGRAIGAGTLKLLCDMIKDDYCTRRQ